MVEKKQYYSNKVVIQTFKKNRLNGRIEYANENNELFLYGLCAILYLYELQRSIGSRMSTVCNIIKNILYISDTALSSSY